jgi:hypothetical protein
MTQDQWNESIWPIRPRRIGRTVTLFAIALIVGLLVGYAGCMTPTSMLPEELERPAANEFGPAERTSNNGLYKAELELPPSLTTGTMYRMKLRVKQANGSGIDNATVSVGGGMPEHGHGLPTAPKATLQGDGVYRIDGVRFKMGGWWVLAFAINGAHGTDTVAFNLDL